MRIHNPNKLPTIDYRTVKELQGDLKDLHHIEQEKLHRVLNKRGFDIPFFLWKNREDDAFYLLDGHQRKRVMGLYDMNDEGKYHVPFVQIAAPDMQTAKERLLEITSQYGRITREGLDEFAAEAEFELDDMDINFDAIVDFGPVEIESVDEAGEEDNVGGDSPKVKRFTIDELKIELAKFEATGRYDGGFVVWLEGKS